MTMADVLIENGWLLPMTKDHGHCTLGWVAVQAGCIAGLGRGEAPPTVRRQASRVIDATNKVVIPGLVNAHTHLSQTFMRGLADGRPLPRWLADVVQPLQAAMTPEDMHLASLLGLVENLRCGVTSVIQHHKLTQTRGHVDATLSAAEQVGIRMLFARGWRDSGARGELPDDIEAEMTRLYRQWHERAAGRIRVAFGPMEPQRCSSLTMQRLLAMARAWGVPTHIHVAETKEEVKTFRWRTGLGHIEWLNSLGALGPDIQLVHCIWISDLELDLIASSGAAVVHCPVSNMRLASGIAPLRKMRDRGISVCLGTDGSASNDSQDLLETLKTAALLAKISTGDAAAVTPTDLLRMATSAGARLVGCADAGRITPGARADVTIINLNTARSMPVHDPQNALIYTAKGADVDTVFVDGQILLDAGRVTVLDEAALLMGCQEAASRLLHRAGLGNLKASRLQVL